MQGGLRGMGPVGAGAAGCGACRGGACRGWGLRGGACGWGLWGRACGDGSYRGGACGGGASGAGPAAMCYLGKEGDTVASLLCWTLRSTPLPREWWVLGTQFAVISSLVAQTSTVGVREILACGPDCEPGGTIPSGRGRAGSAQSRWCAPGALQLSGRRSGPREAACDGALRR